MEFKRRDRLTELLKEEIVLALRKVKDPRLSGFLTLTGVELSEDLKSCIVYYSIFGSDEERLSSATALESARLFVRHELKPRLSLRIIPDIHFEYDRTPERAGRIQEILCQLEKEREAAPQALAPAPEAVENQAPSAGRTLSPPGSRVIGDAGRTLSPPGSRVIGDAGRKTVKRVPKGK